MLISFKFSKLTKKNIYVNNFNYYIFYVLSAGTYELFVITLYLFRWELYMCGECGKPGGCPTEHMPSTSHLVNNMFCKNKKGEFNKFMILIPYTGWKISFFSGSWGRPEILCVLILLVSFIYWCDSSLVLGVLLCTEDPESIEWYIEDQAFSPSYDLAPPPPPPLSRRHTEDWERETTYWRGEND